MTHREVLRDIDRGQSVTVTATFKNSAGTATDPTGVTFYVLPSGGVEVSYIYGTDNEVSKSGTGIYVLTYPIASDVPHEVRCVGTGAVVAANLAIIEVEPDNFS